MKSCVEDPGYRGPVPLQKSHSVSKHSSTTYYLLPTTYSLLPTTYSLLPTTYSLLPTPYSLLPNSTISFNLLISTEVLLMASKLICTQVALFLSFGA